MKFTQNTPVVSPRGIGNVAVRNQPISTDHIAGGKIYDAYVSGMSQVLKFAQQQQDDMDAADHVERRNIIMGNITKRLYGEDGLLTNGIGENAKGLTDRVQQVVKEEFDNGMKGANDRVRRSMAGTFNENMGNYQRIAAQQEGREYTKLKDVNYTSNQNINLDRAIAGYADNESVAFAVNDGLQLLKYRATDQGWSNAQYESEKRKLVGSFAGAAIQTAMDNDDYTQADMLLRKYGRDMDQATKMKFDVTLTKNNNIKMSRDIGSDVVKKFGGDKKAAYDYVFNTLANETETVGGGGNREGNENAWVIYDVFKQAGYDDNAIAGILGRAQQEHNFSTDMAEEKDVPGIGRVGGFGMFQWQMAPEYGGRGIRLHQWAQENGHDVNNGKVQALFALKEAQEKGLTPEALNGKSAEEVADIWTRDWEGGKPGEERRYAGEWRERIKKAAAGGANYDKGYNSIIGQSMANGEIGCVEAVVKGGKAAGIPFFEKQSANNVVDCDTLKENASAAGIAVEDYDPNNPPRKGDVIIYDRGEKQHAVTADGQGGYWGNSSSQNKVVHGSDYNEMGGKVPTQVIRTGNLGGGGGGHTRKKYSESQLKSIWAQYEAQWSDQQQTEAYEKKQKTQQYIDGLKGMSQSQVLSYLEKIKSGENYDVFSSVLTAARGYYPDIFKETNSITGTRRSGSSGGGSKITGASGEKYTAAQLRQAQRVMNRWYKAADPNNPDEVSQRLQDQADEASYKLIDAGLYEGGADVEEQMETYQQMQATAREIWKKNQDYQATVDELISMGWSETNAIKILDSLPDEK